MEERGRKGELPLELQLEREKCLDRPSHFMTRLIDPWYLEHFEKRHYELVDEQLGPWLLGETIKVEGTSHDPNYYTGLLILWSRGTLKSTLLRLIVLWYFLYQKLRLKYDARVAYIHQNVKKAIIHGEAMRDIARHNKEFQRMFHEFRPKGRDWDTKEMWRWPCFANYLANEYSFTAYGEESDKTGGHYTLRAVDDWVTDESVTTTTMLGESERRFRAMDNLRDRTISYSPIVAAGTCYHFDDTWARLALGFDYRIKGGLHLSVHANLASTGRDARTSGSAALRYAF